MPKFPALTAKQIIKFLELNAFILDYSTGSHFIFYNSLNKRRAVIPKHKRQLPKGTLMAILRESGFSKQDITDFFRW